MTAYPDIEYTREMGVTHGDFFRILPKAMGEHEYHVHGTSVEGTVGQGSVEISIGPQQVRRIALLELPYAEVSFKFVGVAEAEQLAFKERFDLYFQRGGG